MRARADHRRVLMAVGATTPASAMPAAIRSLPAQGCDFSCLVSLAGGAAGAPIGRLEHRADFMRLKDRPWGTVVTRHRLVPRFACTTAQRGTWLSDPRRPRAPELTDPPDYNAINRHEEAGILREVTGRQRGKVYVYHEYLSLLNEGTEPLPR